jgi:hypothetical protein
VILDGLQECGMKSLMLLEEHRLRVFENRVLRRIFGHNGKEVTGGCRRIHTEELHDFVPLTVRMIKLRWMIWTVHVACIGDKRNVCKVLHRPMFLKYFKL